jgi:hypothetical protein
LNDRLDALGAANDHDLHRFAAFGGLGCRHSGEKGGVAKVDGRRVRLRHRVKCVDVLAA